MDHPARPPTRPIAVVQGATGPVIQQLFRDLAERWAPTIRLAGAVEVPRIDDGPTSEPGHLRCIPGGERYPLFQQLGSGSNGCALDPAGAILAGETVRRQIAGGCDLVLLSKFGKMEAENGSGLLSAFIAAVEGGIPVLTSVAPRYEESWIRFADPLFVRVAADMQAIDRWWQGARKDQPLPHHVAKDGEPL